VIDLPDMLPDALAQQIDAAADRLGAFRNRIAWYDEVSSTNTVAGDLAERGAPEGTVVVADAQSAGRGRQGRTWSSPPGAGLYFSIVLRPPRTIATKLTIAAGVAMADGIETATGLAVQLKWPNDLYVASRKLGGILAESGAANGASLYVVLGCGINVMSSRFPPEIAGRATSIESELGRQVDRGAVLAECLASLWTRYGELRDERFADILQIWRARASLTFGRAVEWDAAGGVRRGIAESVDDTGALLVRTPAGMERVISGEIRWA
jgi:BirA family biotin operon repressor/biotin-[acetyl-CoA-carboxylase] ligase